MPNPSIRLIPKRSSQLRLLAHTRMMVAVMLPLGAVIGLLVALALWLLEVFEPWMGTIAGQTHLVLLLPAMGLTLTTLWLHTSGTGEVSLLQDLDQARRNPYQAFRFRVSLAKLLGCGLTIGFGGSLGIEGPGKWFGAAVGLQFHRLYRAAASKFNIIRHLHSTPMVMVRGGAGAALSAVFRAPLSGALLAAEHHGRLSADALVPCLVASASGYVAFAAWMGHAPLLPLPIPYTLGAREIAWALVLGWICGLGAGTFRWVRSRLCTWLDPVPFLWRGLVAGLGLTLLAVPGHVFWHGLPITQGGGLELIQHLLAGSPLPMQALLFLALKLAATALTLAGGGIGGIWLPSLAMGAAMGAALDGCLGTGQTGYMAMVGAAAFAGATHKTLLVPCVFLAETTAQAALVVPALVGTTLSYLIAREQS